MNYSNEQFIAAQKSSLQALTTLTEKVFASFEKVVELNMAASKAILSESIASLEALSGAKDFQAALAVQSELSKPLADKASSYSRSLYEIISGATADLTKTLESSSAESQKSVTVFLEDSLKNAPAGSEAAVAAIKSAMTAGSSVVESAKKASKQAAQLVESNIKAVAPAKAE